FIKFILSFLLSLVSGFISYFFFYNHTATTETYTLSLHDALPILNKLVIISATYKSSGWLPAVTNGFKEFKPEFFNNTPIKNSGRSEEHTSELQSLRHLVCRLLLEKKNKKTDTPTTWSTKEYNLKK